MNIKVLFRGDINKDSTSSTPRSHPHGLPVPLTQPPPLLQIPGTPPASTSGPLASASPRLNTNASASVPEQGTQPQQRQQSKAKLVTVDASGHAVEFTFFVKQADAQVVVDYLKPREK